MMRLMLLVTKPAGFVVLFLYCWMLVSVGGCGPVEQRNEVSFHRGSYVNAFYWRHRDAFRIGSAFHLAHGKQHDVLLREPLAISDRTDARFDQEMLRVLASPPRTEPSQELYAPRTAISMWRLFLAIDWTHGLHERTYDIMADRSIRWADKPGATDRVVDYYLSRKAVAFSTAPLELTMRRAAVMFKPYFTIFRNQYPKSNNLFYAAHWWHPAVYEAMILGGNEGQEEVLDQMGSTFKEVMANRPKRMILSREIMPRYSRMSPEAANAFDNLHMVHGITYDILAYDGWNVDEKRREVYRVLDAMAYQPGDDQLVRKFRIPYPDVDPRVYADWMQGSGGAMGGMMMDMLHEMIDHMHPEELDAERRAELEEQIRKKLMPGKQEGELPGSLAEALIELVPSLELAPEMMAPGETPSMMVEHMVRSLIEEHEAMEDIEPWPMEEAAQ